MDSNTRRLSENPGLPTDPNTRSLTAATDELPCVRCYTPLIPVRIVWTIPGGIRQSGPAFYLEQLDGFLVGWGPARIALTSAWVCPECGYTEFYAAESRKMLNQRRELSP